ncbi:hypothetical protein BCV69DRAFT_270750 [Microstroma glucosiphilum]|uniref:Thiamin pyrophosphokinase thiamin-binding domain-containing protein n=1 Tax=Pseudomicrostroma glucosiphilum TaxID=1684307 RepID=A0A316U541_9BASI|nr:hypothetical protein BCV69DRAFT_270750 [Pseudomicrostroma glucosiphilum]PWN20320.1 hypothetical protein BCV69DRAFT_270750 [Pseudomicrostroma glucosiphilum]
MSSLPEHGRAADPPALPPRHTGGSTASGPPLPPRHTEGATTDVVPPLLATGGSLHQPSSGIGGIGSQPPPVPARSEAGSVSTHRVPPPLTASSTTALNYWDPSFLRTGHASQGQTPGAPYAVVLLNQVIADHQKELFKKVWTGAQVRICADGGANQLLHTFGSELNSTLPMPNAIVGDFDSLTPSSRSYFESANVHLAHRPSQYATDLGKSIQWLEDWEQTHEQLELVIWGGLSGRMDQTAHTLHVLWKLCPSLTSTWVVGDESLVYLVPAGVHKLRHPRPALGVCCGILPLGVEASGDKVGARVKTQGLEWDLDPSQPQSMGGYLSTSNHVLGAESSEVTLETDKPIYWSIEFASSSGSDFVSTAGTQQARGSQQTGAALGVAAAGLYSSADPFADHVNVPSSPSHGRRDSRTTPGGVSGAGSTYLSGREGETNNEAIEDLGADSAPPGPTVAETGQVIPSSPSGPGPLSGTLQPRRRSSAYRAGNPISPGMSPSQSQLGTAGAGVLSPSLPARPVTQRVSSDYGEGQGQGQGQGPVGNTTPAYLPPPHASPLSSGSVRPEVLRVPSADFVSRGGGGAGGGGGGVGQGTGQGYGASTGTSPGVSTATGAAPPLSGGGSSDVGSVPGGFPSSPYSSSNPAGKPTSEGTSGDSGTGGAAGAAGGAGGVGLALAAGISHHSTDGASTDGGVRARIRRDGTITRRGVDSDFDQAESEQLPPYTEM